MEGRYLPKLAAVATVVLGLTIPVGSALPGDDVPSYPRELRVALGSPSPSDVTITWSAPIYVPAGGVTQYEINGLKDGIWQPIATVGGTTYTYTDLAALTTGPIPDIVFYEVVPYALDGIGQRSTTMGVEPPLSTSDSGPCNSFGITIPEGGPPEVQGDMVCLVDTLGGPMPDEVEPIFRYYFWKLWNWVNGN